MTPIIITTHINPDGDAIGSALALQHVLRLGGNAAVVLLPSACPRNLLWLPGASEMVVWNSDSKKKAESDVIPTKEEVESDVVPTKEEVLIANAETIFVLDLNTLKRLDSLGEAIAKSNAKIINIDHHTHPDAFAAVQIVDNNAPATCYMLYKLFTDPDSYENNPFVTADIAITADTATCLYVGIMTDTGSFRFPRTTPDVLRTGAHLVELGADPVEAYDKTFNVESVSRTRMLGAALSNMELHHDGKLCIMKVSQQDFATYNCTTEDTEGFVHFTLSLEGVYMGILFVELHDVIKCSFRSKGQVFVRDLAASYGGGGHVYAAGARIKGKMEEVVSRVVQDAANSI